MMFTKIISVLTLVVGMTLSFSVSAAPAKVEPEASHEASATKVQRKESRKKKNKKKRTRVQADDQKSSVSSLNYQGIDDCLTQAGIQWKGMKQDSKTGEYVLAGPKKNGVPEFYLVMGKHGLYRIDTKGLKDNSLLDVSLGDKKRKMAWGKKDGLWIQQDKDSQVPERFKDLKPVAHDAKVQQYDKLVESLVSKPVRRHYKSGIQTTLQNASAVVADSRKPLPEIVSEVEKMNAIIAKYSDQESQLRTQFQNGAITRAELDSKAKTGSQLVNVNQAGIKAIAALQAHRETRAYTTTERLMAYKAVDAEWERSPLKAGIGACKALLGSNPEALFPKADPEGVAKYARLRLFGAK